MYNTVLSMGANVFSKKSRLQKRLSLQDFLCDLVEVINIRGQESLEHIFSVPVAF